MKCSERTFVLMALWTRRTIRGMRRLIILTTLVAFVVWRNKRITEHDRTHGFGAYARVVPVADP